MDVICARCLSRDFYRHDPACPRFGGSEADWQAGFGDGIVLAPLRYRHPSYDLGHRIGVQTRNQNAIDCGHEAAKVAPPPQVESGKRQLSLF